MTGLPWLLAFLCPVALLATLAFAYRRTQRLQKKTATKLTVNTMELTDEKARREEAEATLGLQKEWYRILFNNTKDMVFVYGVTEEGLPDRYLQVNDVACQRLEIARERLLDMTTLDIQAVDKAPTTLGYTRAERVTMSDADIRARERAFATRAARTFTSQVLDKKQIVCEQVYVSRTGKRIPVETTVHLLDLTGSPMIMCTAHDITERKAIQRALRESEQRFQDFFAGSPIGVAMFDPERKLLNVNRACLKMFGVPGQAEFSRFDFFGNPFIPEQTGKAIRRGETVSVEMDFDFDKARGLALLISSRSKLANFDVLVNNLGLDHDFNPKGYLVQVQDITERRRAESALRQSERQLQQAQKMEAVGTLAGGIAHDFNNILTPILGYADIALDLLPHTDEKREYIEQIRKASYRAKDLVSQILTFSRRSDQDVVLKPVRITLIVKEVVKLLHASLPKSIEIRPVIKTEHDIILADPTQIHQVLMNLSTNASHAMRSMGGGLLEVRMMDFILDKRTKGEFAQLESGRYLRISIKDTGPGMDQITADRIFEPFFTTKKSGEGTGMGLAVVHGIVTGLKGSITVDTKPGKGATFHVVLPVIEQQADHVEAATSIPTGSENVLFLDDDPDVAEMATHMLKSLGYHPVITGKPIDALNMFRQNPDAFDIVITDQVMPDMTGDAFAKALFKIREDIPVVICTGYSETFSLEQARAIGIESYLVKPLSRRSLAEAIRHALDRKKVKA